MTSTRVVCSTTVWRASDRTSRCSRRRPPYWFSEFAAFSARLAAELFRAATSLHANARKAVSLQLSRVAKDPLRVEVRK